MPSFVAGPIKSRSSLSRTSFDSALSSVANGNVVAPSWIGSLNNVVFDSPWLGKKKLIALAN